MQSPRDTAAQHPLTFQIYALLLPKRRRHILHPARQRDLDILGNDLVAGRHGARGLGVAHHALNAQDGALALVKAARDFLGDALNGRLLFALDPVVVKARQHVLGM